MESKDLILEKGKYKDWEAMYRNVWSRPEAAKYMAWRVTADEEAAKERMRRTLTWQGTHDTWLVYEKGSGQAVGFAGIEELRPGIYQDTGIALGPEYVGRGYGKQILRLLMEYCSSLGGEEFYYSTRAGNLAAKALALSCGFAYQYSEQKTDLHSGRTYELEIYRKELKGESEMNTYQVIDEKNWERAMHCMVFRESVEPAFCVTFEADITNFRRRVREQKFSFTLAFVYTVCKCANEIETFRYRFLDGKVVLFDHIDTAFTYLNQDTGLFKVVNVPLRGSIQEYVETAGRIAREQKEYFTGPLGNDVFQCSPMPWITYTHISHTNSGKKDAATPLFDWGKYYEKDGRLVMPVSVQAHHSFVDGIHIGQFADLLQKDLETYSCVF